MLGSVVPLVPVEGLGDGARVGEVTKPVSVRTVMSLGH